MEFTIWGWADKEIEYTIILRFEVWSISFMNKILWKGYQNVGKEVQKIWEGFVSDSFIAECL